MGIWETIAAWGKAMSNWSEMAITNFRQYAAQFLRSIAFYIEGGDNAADQYSQDRRLDEQMDQSSNDSEDQSK